MAIPQLPHELWMEIVEDTTYIPGELDYRTYDPFLSPSPRNLEQAIAQVLPTRHSFTLVSQFFHSVALPILYQTLLITDCNLLWTIVRCLEANTARSRMSPNVQEHAQLVKRIHFAAYSERRWPKAFAKPIAATFDFTNLIIVGGNGNRLGSEEFGSFLRDHFLERCSAACSIDGTWYSLVGRDINHGLHFVRSHRNLRSLCSPLWAWLASNPVPEGFKESVSRVEALAIANYWPFATVPLPTLPYLCALRLIIFNRSNLHHVETLGARVTFLDVTSSISLEINLDIFPSLRTFINRVGIEPHSRCTAHSPHSGLARIAFSDQFTLSRRKFKCGIMEFVDTSLLPKLKQIRLIDMRICRHFVHQNPSHVRLWVNQGLERGIRLEAGDGRLLSDLIR
jgi:hypothetical protein